MSEKQDRVALYARVSTIDQTGASQLERLRSWATHEGRHVVLERVDSATGKNVRRPGLSEIMAEARGHHLSAVVVVKVDRWARSVMDLSATLHELRDLGVEWIAVDQGIRISPDRSDPTSSLILHILSAVAEWEASIISERTRQSMAYLRSTGKHVGRPVGSKDRVPRSKKGYLQRYAEVTTALMGGSPLTKKGVPYLSQPSNTLTPSR
jgi:DNA invertase Pin-like site-specific DNA recombinase